MATRRGQTPWPDRARRGGRRKGPRRPFRVPAAAPRTGLGNTSVDLDCPLQRNRQRFRINGAHFLLFRLL